MGQDETDQIQYSILSFCCLVTVVSCSMACRYIYKKFDTNSAEVKQVFILLSLNCLLCVSSILPPILFKEAIALCYFQGMAIQVFSLAGVLWTCYIAFAVYYEVFIGWSRDSLRNAWVLAGILMFSVATAIIPAITKNYDISGSWCWYVSADEERANGYKIGFFYAILWVVIVANIFFYVRVIYRIKQNVQDKKKLEYYNALRIYPLVLIIGYIPLSIIRLMGKDAQKLDGIVQGTAAASAFARLIGFANSLVYVWLNRNRFTQNQASPGENIEINLSEENQ